MGQELSCKLTFFQPLFPTTSHFLSQYETYILSHLHLSIQENVLNNLRIVSGVYCPSNQNDCFENNRNMAGYHIVPEGTHDFMNVAQGSYFMDPSNPWGLHMNFDWLAREGRVSN